MIIPIYGRGEIGRKIDWIGLGDETGWLATLLM